MTIEHMAENPTGVTGEPLPTGGEVPGEPVVVTPEVKPSFLGRVRRWPWGGPKPQVLVEAGEQPPPTVTASETPIDQPSEPASPSDQEPLAAGLGGSGGGNGGPEGPRGPEPPRGSDWETSPERGRGIVEAIVRLRTDSNLSYEQRYALRDEQGRPLMAQLYKELQEYVNAICRIRNEKDPWDRYVRDEKGKVIGVKEIDKTPLLIKFDEKGIPHLIDPSQTDQQAGAEQPDILVTDEQRTMLRDHPLQTLLADYANPATPATRRQEMQELLSIYFGLAKKKGLLDGVDQVLKSIYRDIKGVPADQARRLIAQRIGEAQETAELTFGTNSTDQEVVELYGVWSVYIRWARQRFELMLQGKNQPEYRGWEFQLPKVGGRETYWEIGNYPKYYRVTANNQEQLLRAKETFLRMIKKGYLGKSPEAIYQHVDNFKEAFGQRGEELVEAGVIDGDSLIEQRQELEALLYIFGADYSNDTYNPKQYKEFMTAMALHEGPARWVRLLRAGEGQVGAFSFIFDKEAIMEIFNNPVGERGELDIIAQHYLQDQVREKVIERGMGIALKDYDPKDPNNDVRFIDDDNAKEVRAEELKANLERIGIHMPDEEFKNLYEGFDDGYAHILNFLSHRQLTDNQLQQLPEILKDSIALGRIQLEINKIRLEIQNGATVLKRGETLFNRLLDNKRISKEDKDLYMSAYARAEANFDIAFQMQGASGEKVRRGKGFFYVDRNIHIQAYQKVQRKDDINTNGSDLTLQQKRSRWNDDSQWLGWIISELREGRAFETFSREEQYFYKGLGIIKQDGKFEFKDHNTANLTQSEINQLPTPDDREDYVDHIPTYLAEKFVQYAVTKTKIAYSDESGVWEKNGFNKNRFIEIEIEGKDGKKEKLKFISKTAYRTYMMAQARKEAIEKIKTDGFKAKLELPKVKFNTDETSSNFGDVLGIDGDQTEPVDFQTAVKHIYSRYTTHTYWGYQGENRQMILRPELFDAAKSIRAGLSRPEDVDGLATQLLIIDPTLRRVKKFKTDEIQREITLFQAAVEESFLSHVYINKDLFKAFLPKDGVRGKMRAGYNMEDWGGMMRFTMGIRELSASQPARFSRRLGAEIAIMPIYTDSMAAIWGQDGVMGAVSMFADKIKDIGHQGIVSQFGITKFIDQMDYAVQLYNALIGSVQEGKHVEGLYMKPTNDNDKLHQFYGKQKEIADLPNMQLPFLAEFRERYGRLETVLKIMRAMYSDVRNAGGALRLENVDTFLDNGKFNPDIESGPDIHMNTGTSRHLGWDFYDEFIKWLISEEPGGGGKIYPNERYWNSFFRVKLVYFLGGKEVLTSDKTIAEWFFDKAAL